MIKLKKTGIGSIVKRGVLVALAFGGVVYYSDNCSSITDLAGRILPDGKIEAKYDSGNGSNGSYSLEQMQTNWDTLTGEEKFDFIRTELQNELRYGYQDIRDSIDSLTSKICEEYKR